MATIPQALEIATRHHVAGQLAEAEAIYRQILAQQPAHSGALHLLGVIASQCGKPESAVEMIREALRIQPDFPAACVNLGNALHALHRRDEAGAAYRRAIELQPDFAEAHNNLGAILREQGRLGEAIAAYQRAAQCNPAYAEAHSNLGVALCEQNRHTEAIAACQRALQLRPDFADAHYNLGNAFGREKSTGKAIAAYRRAIELRPDFAMAFLNLGSALMEQGRFDEAVEAYRRAIVLMPESAIARNNMGNALKDQGRLDEAIACYTHAIRLQPDSAAIHSNFLAALDCCPEPTLAALFEAHCEYDRRHAAPLRKEWRLHPNSRDPVRTIRLGFVSAHFGFHPVGRFLIRLLENLDPEQFHVACYSDSPTVDQMTARIQKATAVWREVSALTDEQLDRQIRDDGMDILFDLAGHTVGNRLLVFARKPAPIQITWLDYAGTTGVGAMDCILADHRQIPPGADHWFTEKILRMPDDYICYDPPLHAPPVAPLPALGNGHVTFGSFNALNKISARTLGIWARILGEVPKSRLILMHRGLDAPATVSRLHGFFATHGITADRVELIGFTPSHEVLAAYNRIDIALDTLPYNGGLTTCEALWMGVPVVTCPGETFASRHGLAHLTAAGVRGTIARDPDHYVEIATRLAADLPGLAELRNGLRAQVATSPLCDGKRFAMHFMALMRDVWQQWITQSAPDGTAQQPTRGNPASRP